MIAYHWEDCGIFCRKNPKCNFWHYYEEKNECVMYNKCVIHKSTGKIMGEKDCPSKQDANPSKYLQNKVKIICTMVLNFFISDNTEPIK